MWKKEKIFVAGFCILHQIISTNSCSQKKASCSAFHGKTCGSVFHAKGAASGLQIQRDGLTSGERGESTPHQHSSQALPGYPGIWNGNVMLTRKAWMSEIWPVGFRAYWRVFRQLFPYLPSLSGISKGARVVLFLKRVCGCNFVVTLIKWAKGKNKI